MEVSREAETWFSIFQQSFKGMVNVSLMEANLKVISHWYLDPSHLANIFLNSSPLFFRRCDFLGSFFHTWWECPQIRGFWNKIFCLPCKIMGQSLPKTPELALLNSKTFGCSKSLWKRIYFILLGAKIMIACALKQHSVSFAAAKQKILWIMIQEKTANLILDTSDKFDVVWEPWKKYLKWPLWLLALNYCSEMLHGALSLPPPLCLSSTLFYLSYSFCQMIVLHMLLFKYLELTPLVVHVGNVTRGNLLN